MTEGKFEKVRQTDKKLYGPEKLLLCGFTAAAHPLFEDILKKAGLWNVDVVWVNEGYGKHTLSQLIDLPDNTGVGKESTLPRAIIVSGITENQLHALMTICRESGMKRALWAVLTPTSEKWALENLIEDLKAEQKALTKGNRT